MARLNSLIIARHKNLISAQHLVSLTIAYLRRYLGRISSVCLPQGQLISRTEEVLGFSLSVAKQLSPHKMRRLSVLISANQRAIYRLGNAPKMSALKPALYVLFYVPVKCYLSMS